MQALANTDERTISVFTPKEYLYNGLYEEYIAKGYLNAAKSDSQ